MDKIVVVMVKDGTVIGCTIKGETCILPLSAPIDQWFVSGRWYNWLMMRNIKYCGSYDVAIVDEVVFNLLVQRLTQQDTDKCHVTGIRAYAVDMSEDNYNFSVNLRGDRWYCDYMQCKARNHYDCKHARYVNRIVPMEAATPRPDPNEKLIEIETY